MNRFLTIALVLLAGATVAFLVFVEPRLKSTRDRSLAAGFFADWDAGDVRKVSMKDGDQTVELERREDGWRLTKPLKDEASTDAVGKLLGALVDLRSLDHIPSGEFKSGKLELKDFGLRNARRVIAVQTETDGEKRIFFGKEAAGADQVYVRTGEGDDVYLVRDDLEDIAFTPVDTYRSLTLSSVPLDDIERFTIRRAEGEMELRRKGNGWEMTKPLRAAVDPAAAESFLRTILGSKITKFVAPDSANLSAYGIEEGREEVTISRRSHPEREIRFRFGGAVPDAPDSIYLQTTARDMVVEIPRASFEAFTAMTPETLRDRTFATLNLDTVDRFVVERDGSKLLIRRDGEGWITDPDKTPVSADAVAHLVKAITETRIDGFRDASGETFAEVGLDPAAVTLTFSAWLSENSAEEDAGEKPILRLAFGRSPDGKTVARRNDDPEVLVLTGDVLSDLSADPAAWAPSPPIPPAQPNVDPSSPSPSAHP